MIRDVMRDVFFLGQKSQEVTVETLEADVEVAVDLLDTLTANAEGCVGMAANMIGVQKRIIVFDNDGQYFTMFNPVILKKSGKYETQEGCLSLEGKRPCVRYKSIRVEYKTAEFKTKSKTFTGFTAQIIQHEIDHCNGIII